jgi:hypothetical protein
VTWNPPNKLSISLPINLVNSYISTKFKYKFNLKYLLRLFLWSWFMTDKFKTNWKISTFKSLYKVAKLTVCISMSVTRWTDLHDILNWGTFVVKYDEKIQTCLKSDKKHKQFIWWTKDIHDYLVVSVSGLVIYNVTPTLISLLTANDSRDSILRKIKTYTRTV